MTVSDALKQLISIRVDIEYNQRSFPDEIIFQNDLAALDIAIRILKDILKEDEKK